MTLSTQHAFASVPVVVNWRPLFPDAHWFGPANHAAHKVGSNLQHVVALQELTPLVHCCAELAALAIWPEVLGHVTAAQVAFATQQFCVRVLAPPVGVESALLYWFESHEIEADADKQVSTAVQQVIELLHEVATRTIPHPGAKHVYICCCSASDHLDLGSFGPVHISHLGP